MTHPEALEQRRAVASEVAPRAEVVAPQTACADLHGRGYRRPVESAPVRIATWNVNSLKARLPRVEEWLADVPARRPLHAGDQARRRRVPGDGVLTRSATRRSHHGEGRWNGVAILSRVGLDDVVAGFADGDEPTDAEARLVVGHVRRRPRRERLRAQRPRRSTTSTTSTSSSGSSGCERTSTPRATPTSRRRRVRRLQHRARRPRRVGPDAVHRRHPRQRARARRARRARATGAWSTSFRRHYDDDRPVLVVGLPGRRLPQAPRHAHRPRAGAASRWPSASRWALIDRNARKGKLPSDHAPVIVDFDDRG